MSVPLDQAWHRVGRTSRAGPFHFPGDFMSRHYGEIFEWNAERRFGFIRMEGSGKHLFFKADSVSRDWKKSRAWAFYNGEGLPVRFDVVAGLGQGERAENIEPEFPLEEPGDLESLREVSVIHHMVHGKFGFLTRPDSDELFFHVENVGKEFLDRRSLLRPGVPVFHGVGFGRDGQSRAVNIELFSWGEIYGEPEPG